MSGNDRVRFCSHCVKNVNDLSTMTRKEATRFVRSSDGNICIRYRVDPVTRRPMFAEQLLQITRRAPAIAAGVVTASISLSTAGYAQTSDPPPSTSTTTVAVFKDRVIPSDPGTTGSGRITGTVTDPAGAVIPAAKVTLLDGQGAVVLSTTSNEIGVYSFDSIGFGTYRVRIESPGFMVNERDVSVGERSDAQVDTQLGIEITATVEVKADATLSVGLVNGGAIVVVEYTSELARAVADQDKGLVRELISKGVEVNAKESSYNKITPMFLAVESGDVEIVQMLLDAGAKVNVRSTSKETPLMRLDSDGTRPLVELLIRNGARVNVADKDGNTPLILAAENSTDDAIAALIEAGADVNSANNDGETALMKAADRDDIQSVRALLFTGANVNAKDKDGENAWDKTTNDEVEALLVSFGSEVHDVPPDQSPTPTPVPEPTPPI
ncbi:MAG TPA: ankyrin repeat domain-containing protein [Pyrinomonadaceae bacterium]|jgi:hypothetical protein